jgi:hypothetical protein
MQIEKSHDMSIILRVSCKRSSPALYLAQCVQKHLKTLTLTNNVIPKRRAMPQC